MKYLKPLIFTFVLLLSFSTNIDAQQHLKFMGIPINGSIDNFQQKLASKGIYPSKEMNRNTPFGVRCFTGRFTGKQCNIYVYYTDSKIVYRAKAVYSEQDEDLVDSYYKEVKDMLDNKYALEESENETSDGYPSHRIYVTDETDSRSLGQIVLYKSKFNGDYGYVSYSIHVVYYDDSNQIKHQNDNLDDL